MYQGARARDRYFEGWYFKSVAPSCGEAIAVIPGVSLDEAGRTSHAFVQVMRAGGVQHYFPYPRDAFVWDPDAGFRVSVGPNTFTTAAMHLDLTGDDGALVRGDVSFGTWRPWPVTLLSPGIMGWYRFVPGMETYHGVLSLDHAVNGAVEFDGDRIDLGGGRGYVEKDWGTGFPSSWVWMQTNTFEREGISLTASVARVPFMTGAFVGFIAGLLVDGELHRFATYTGAHLERLETGPQRADILLLDRRLELSIHAEGRPGRTAELKAPVLGAMAGRDAESLDATVEVVLRERGSGAVLFEGAGRCAGLEVMDRGELAAGTAS